MIFLHPNALWGLVLCVIPLLLYWLLRRRPEVIQWGAMRFLRDLQHRIQIQRKLRDVLRIVSRMGVIFCVVLACAAPCWWEETAVKQENRNQLILLDSSISMDARYDSSSTRLEAAKKVCGNAKSTLLFDSWSTPISIPSDVSEVFLLSDVPDSPEFYAFLKRISEATPKAAHKLVSIFEPATNIRLSDLHLAQTPPVIRQNLPVKLTVMNDSSEPHTAICVEFTLQHIDSAGRLQSLAQGEKWLNIPPQTKVQTNWEVQFPEPGKYTLTARLKQSDDFPADDFCSKTIQVRESASFLLVDSWEKQAAKPEPADSRNSSTKPSESVTSVLSLSAAFRAIYGARYPELPNHALRLETILDPDFTVLDLSQYDGIFLLDTILINKDEAEHLLQYVRSGGSLCFFPSFSETTEEFLSPNSSLASILPAWTVKENQTPNSSQSPNFFRTPTSSHPIAALFTENPDSGLEQIPVSKWLSLKPSPDAETVLEFTTGEPFLVVRSIGVGRTAITAIPADSASSLFPLLPVWVPLIDQMVLWLTQTGDESGTNLKETEYLNRPCNPSKLPKDWNFVTLNNARILLMAEPPHLWSVSLLFTAAVLFLVLSRMKLV